MEGALPSPVQPDAVPGPLPHRKPHIALGSNVTLVYSLHVPRRHLGNISLMNQQVFESLESITVGNKIVTKSR